MKKFKHFFIEAKEKYDVKFMPASDGYKKGWSLVIKGTYDDEVIDVYPTKKDAVEAMRELKKKNK